MGSWTDRSFWGGVFLRAKVPLGWDWHWDLPEWKSSHLGRGFEEKFLYEYGGFLEVIGRAFWPMLVSIVSNSRGHRI